MPLLARLFIKTALAYLVVALLIGVALAADGMITLPPPLAGFGATWVHLLVVGWLTQLIFGVSYWLFPRHSRDRPFGQPAPAWSAFVLLNIGLILRVGVEPAFAWSGGPGWRAALIVSAGLQALGTLAFVVYIWPRIRTK